MGQAYVWYLYGAERFGGKIAKQKVEEIYPLIKDIKQVKQTDVTFEDLTPIDQAQCNRMNYSGFFYENDTFEIHRTEDFYKDGNHLTIMHLFDNKKYNEPISTNNSSKVRHFIYMLHNGLKPIGISQYFIGYDGYLVNWKDVYPELAKKFGGKLQKEKIYKGYLETFPYDFFYEVVFVKEKPKKNIPYIKVRNCFMDEIYYQQWTEIS